MFKLGRSNATYPGYEPIDLTNFLSPETFGAFVSQYNSIGIGLLEEPLYAGDCLKQNNQVISRSFPGA